MDKRALITGVTGQDGAYLAKLLLEKGYHVIGTVRRQSTPDKWRLQHLGIADQIEYAEMDLLEYGNVHDTLLSFQDCCEIYHLAAQSFVGSSFKIPTYTWDVNARGTMLMLEIVQLTQAKFYHAGSSEMFGHSTRAGETLDEESRCRPRSPYAASKLAAHRLVGMYRSLGVFAVGGICFNHESPLRGEEFVTRKIVRGLLRFKKDGTPLELGNVEAQRDWGYAPEYVEGIWLAMQYHEADDFVFATGQTNTVRTFCDLVAEAIWDAPLVWGDQGAEHPNGGRAIILTEKHKRPADVDVLLGDARKAREKLGWEPMVMLPALAKLMVEEEA